LVSRILRHAHTSYVVYVRLCLMSRSDLLTNHRHWYVAGHLYHVMVQFDAISRAAFIRNVSLAREARFRRALTRIIRERLGRVDFGCECAWEGYQNVAVAASKADQPQAMLVCCRRSIRNPLARHTHPRDVASSLETPLLQQPTSGRRRPSLHTLIWIVHALFGSVNPPRFQAYLSGSRTIPTPVRSPTEHQSLLRHKSGRRWPWGVGKGLQPTREAAGSLGLAPLGNP
jgi:hypothetical protein